jgi:GntR family transcriptional repressor for pyruvate dehydrogenase complex
MGDASLHGTGLRPFDETRERPEMLPAEEGTSGRVRGRRAIASVTALACMIGFVFAAIPDRLPENVPVPPPPTKPPRRRGRRPGTLSLAVAGKTETAGDLVSQVIHHLRSEIVSGTHAAGTTLPSEGNLAESFAVSRTVIREAMRSLRSQGLIIMSQGARPRVAEVDFQPTVESLELLLKRSRTTLLHLTEVRQPLESTIAQLAAERASEQQVAALQDAIDELKRATTLAARVTADIRFHDLLAEATGNPVFSVLLKTLAGLLVASRRRTIQSAGPQPALVGHVEILTAIRNRDPQAAAAAMRRHLGAAEENIKKTMTERRAARELTMKPGGPTACTKS